MAIQAGAYDGFMDPIGAHSFDPLLTPSSRADEGVGVLIVWVNVRVILGVRILDKDSGPPTDSARVIGHVGGGRPYDTVSLFGSEVLDFRDEPLGGVDFWDSDDLGPPGRDHVEVVFKRPSEVMANNVKRTGLRLNALGVENVNRVEVFPPEGVNLHP